MERVYDVVFSRNGERTGDRLRAWEEGGEFFSRLYTVSGPVIPPVTNQYDTQEEMDSWINGWCERFDVRLERIH